MSEASPAVESATATVAEPASSTKELRFGFGANWRQFQTKLDQLRFDAAVASLTRHFGHDGLQGRRFLDIGSGSGLFSAAAYHLGANVVSFDYDQDSVACTETLQRQLHADPLRWRVEQGSVLDAAFMSGLGTFDIVYAWGVLHHTGDLWTAVNQACQRVNSHGWLWLALYNDQGAWSVYWARIKRIYQKLPKGLRSPFVAAIGSGWGLYEWGLVRIPAAIGATLLRLLTLRNPLVPLLSLVQDIAAGIQRRRTDRDERGMSAWTDLVDWVGGYPFEVSHPEAIFEVVHQQGFELRHLRTCGGGSGCNEFLFIRMKPPAADALTGPENVGR